MHRVDNTEGKNIVQVDDETLKIATDLLDELASRTNRNLDLMATTVVMCAAVLFKHGWEGFGDNTAESFTEEFKNNLLATIPTLQERVTLQ